MANPPVTGDDNGVGFGVKGSSNNPYTGRGVEGFSASSDGVFGQATASKAVGVHGVHIGFNPAVAILGESKHGITAIKGQQGTGSGLAPEELLHSGVWGDSAGGPGTVGTSSAAEGVFGEGATFGVRGSSIAGGGVFGESQQAEGVRGSSHSSHPGVMGVNDNPDQGSGVFGTSRTGDGVHGESNHYHFLVAGVKGVALNQEGLGAGVMGESKGKGAGVMGQSINSAGILGLQGDPALQETLFDANTLKAGVFGASESGPGVLGYSRNVAWPAVFAYGGLRAIALNRPWSAYFQGDIQVDGCIQRRRARGRGVSNHEGMLRSYAQDTDSKWLAEFGCSHLKSGEAGYMFPLVVRCAIILPMHRAKGVRP